jgi:uncharacterized protein Yka (UPF0111/DUF47 family)
MTVQKTRIVRELSGSALLLPDLIAAALAANARIKFALSWLQASERPVDSSAHRDELGPERTLAGLADDSLYAAPSGVVGPNGVKEIPRSGAVVARLLEDVACMRSATEAGAEAGVLDGTQSLKFRQREDALRQSIHLDGDRLDAGFVAMLSRLPREGCDTIHGLVMDMHRALNTMAAALAEEDIAGAKVYRLSADDKPRVAALMRGLNRTAPLKLDHPGLATTATRDGGRLLIQNDIGTTDAHVLIVQLEGLRISVTYSDIHRPRLAFFERRLKDFSWTDSNRRASGFEEDLLSVATGIFEAGDTAALDAALAQLGSNIVYLIDWNRARKSLRRLTSKSEAVRLLDWAAAHEVGHRGYLEAGGDALIADLLEAVSKATGAFHISLQSAVGADGVVDFLQEALRIASEGLRAGRPASAVRDILRAELLARVASIGERIVDVALEHAALVLDLGNLVRGVLLDGRGAPPSLTERAKRWEARADRQVRRIRELSGTGRERAWCQIASAADDAADSFEETAFRLQFLPADSAPDIRVGLLRLAEHAVDGVKNYVRLLGALRNIRRGAPHQDMRDFLDLIEALHASEHATDDDERAIFCCLMRADTDARALAVVTSVAGGLEETADALLRAAHLISDHVLGEWYA